MPLPAPTEIAYEYSYCSQCTKTTPVLLLFTWDRNLCYGNLQTMSMNKWATSKSTQLSTKVYSFCLKSTLKLNFWGPLTNWKFEPSPMAHTPTSKNTQNRSKNYPWIYHGMHWSLCYRSKLSITLKSKDLAILAFKKNSRCTHQNQLKPSPVSERSAYPL